MKTLEEVYLYCNSKVNAKPQYYGNTLIINRYIYWSCFISGGSPNLSAKRLKDILSRAITESCQGPWIDDTKDVLNYMVS